VKIPACSPYTPRQHRDRPEGLEGAHVAGGRDVLEQRRLQHHPLAPSAAQQLGARLERLPDPALEALGLSQRDHRADEGVVVLRIAHAELPGRLHELLPQLLVHGLVGEDALHADAALARLVEGPEHDALDRVVEVPTLVHHDRRVPAELEHHLLLARASLEIPAHPGRAGEAQQLQALVLGEERGTVTAAGQDGEGALRKIGLGEDLADQERPHRREAGRLEDEGTAHGERRRDLVRGQIQGEVEGRDERAGADRNPPPQTSVAACARRDVQGHDLAHHAHRLLGGDAEGVDQAAHLAPAVPDGLAGLDAEREGQLLGTGLETAHAVLENRLALVGGQLPHGRRRPAGRGDRGVDGPGVCNGDAGRHLPTELVPHLEVPVGGLGPVGEVEGVAALEHCVGYL
jgi:hypothetical protein